MIAQHWPVLLICLFCIVGILVRPFKLPEATWAVSAALLLLVCRLISPAAAWSGISKGLDVYLFLAGMMLMAEAAREEKLFDWLAAKACSQANGSPHRLFLLVYAVGCVVTIFMSNDATAVVLTPAVAAAVRTARIRKPLPYLLICAFTANAASFVLPISNPANLVIYGSRLPPLLQWIPAFALSSLVAIIGTFFLLKWTQRREFQEQLNVVPEQTDLSLAGKLSGLGIVFTTVVLLVCSGLDVPLGLPTFLCGIVISMSIATVNRSSPFRLYKAVSWSVILLVAGLFVLVEALNQIGLVSSLSAVLQDAIRRSPDAAAGWSGWIVAIASNVVNNLPSGLISGSVLQTVNAPGALQRAVLIGVDLGPNLSVTGSLATILWLLALRREGIELGAWKFLKIGAIVMIPTLALALAAAIYW